jgi:two-component system cell cycle response regulator DivK
VGQKILIVEDNELNLKLFCDLLRAHGFEVEPVRDGRDALERARAFAPDWSSWTSRCRTSAAWS